MSLRERFSGERFCEKRPSQAENLTRILTILDLNTRSFDGGLSLQCRSPLM